MHIHIVSLERESNENANRLIRRFIPKGVSMDCLTHKTVRRIEEWINNYPRAMFEYKTSNEYKQELGYVI